MSEAHPEAAHPGAGLPPGAQLLALARQGGIAVWGATLPPPASVLDLLAAGDVGAVLPVRAAPAGDTAPGGGPAGQRVAAAVRRDVERTTATAVAFAPGALGGIRLAPDLADPAAVVSAAVGHVRGLGLRVLADPAWADPAGHAAEVTADRSAGIDVLVATAFLDAGPAHLADRFVFDLVASLVEQMVDGRVTVLLTDGFRSESQVERLRANGVDVAVAPLDVDGWLAQRLGRFSHVLVSPEALRSSLTWERIERHQPQAARVLCLPSLPFREVAALGPLTPLDEQDSLETVRAAVESRSVEDGQEADAVWCATEADARWARGCLPAVPVHVIGGRADRPDAAPPLEGRSGLLLFAAAGHDVVMANEDAAAIALREVVPRLRRRHPDLEVRVVVDQPTPFFVQEMAVSGAEAVASEDAVAAARRARVLLESHPYGTGGEAALRLALGQGTPFVAHPASVGRLDLGALAGVSVFGDAGDVAYRISALLDDDDRWRRHRDLVDEVAADLFDAGRRAAALQQALVGLGVDAVASSGRWIDEQPKDARPRYRPVEVPLRPPGAPEPPPLEETPGDPDERYQLWARRFGPSDALLACFRLEMARLAHWPTFSVLMPVFDTPAPILREAIDSVLAQVYDRWQLVLADDGSTRAETLDVLDHLPDDPRIRLVRPQKRSGIAGATNAALDAADGDFVTFLDHDDLLKPHALAQVARWLDADPTLDVVYSDEDKLDPGGNLVQAHLKPDWSPNLIMSQNYVCHLHVVRRSLLAEVGGLRLGFDGSQDHDLVLRLVERTDRIAHIPEPLYTWRIIPGSAATEVTAKPYALAAAKRALADALERRGHPGVVDDAPLAGMYRTRYHRFGEPRVGIIVPTRDGLYLLEPCLRSVFERSTYRNFEVVLVDNQSTDAATLAYLARFPGRVLRYPYPFNYARIMNAAARATDCDAYLFLNNDTEVITPEWIELLLEHAMRRDVGAVGVRLYHPNPREGLEGWAVGEPPVNCRVQHEGTVVGLSGMANNVEYGYFGRGHIVRDVSAVMGACTMMRSSVFWRLGGNDERLRVAYNDVDLCLRAHQAGLAVVYTPDVELYHHESASRAGKEHDDDGPQFAVRWRPRERSDPLYHPLFCSTWPPFTVGLEQLERSLR